MNTVASLFAILPYPQIDPIALSIGPVAIRWYGLAYVTGILIGWWLARRMIANLSLWPGNATPITEKHLDDFLVWAAIGIVLGGRIGYILFYDLQPVLDNPVVALEIWRGGMSFHGGLTGATLAMIVFARRNGLPVWMLFDLVACVAPIGLFSAGSPISSMANCGAGSAMWPGPCSSRPAVLHAPSEPAL